MPIWHLIKNKLKFHRRLRLNNKDVSILANSCVGGFVYDYFGLPYNSPTVGLLIEDCDFVRFISDIEKYKSMDLQFINPSDSKHRMLYENHPKWGWPIAMLDDIEIHFMHYRTKDEAATKWKRRISRLNLQNLIILFAETENTAADTLKQILASKRFCILLTWKKIYGLINEHYSEVVANSEEHHWPPQIVCSSIDWKAAFNCLKNNDRIS